jgi:hypothetical protein
LKERKQMLKRKYMLTRFYNKPCTHDAIRRIPRPGNQPDIIEKTQISFEPNKITKVDADLDMSAVIDSGFIVEIVKKIKPEPVKVEEPKVEKVPVEKKVEPKVEPEVKVEPKVEVKIKAEPEAKPELEDEPEIEPKEDKVKPKRDRKGYEKMVDGTYQCLACKDAGEKKIFKSKRWAANHVQDKHR